MELEQLADQSTGGASTVAVVPPASGRPMGNISPQADATCATCGSSLGPDPGADAAYPYVYAFGRVEPRFPRLDVEKEFAQAVGRADTVNLTDRAALQQVLSQRQNRYLVRQLCWVLTIEGLETYLLQPRDPAELDLLIEALRPAPSPMDIDVVIGRRGPIALPQMCNGLMIPIVIFDQLYSFDRDSFIKSIPRPAKTSAKEYEPMAGTLLDRIMQMADNAGATDEHRALNYCVARYPALYATVADAFGRNFSLRAIDVRPSRLSTTRKILDVILSCANRQTDVIEQYFVRVDVTEEFPFLVTAVSPYFER